MARKIKTPFDKSPFNTSQQRVIRSMLKINIPATAFKISKKADDMSWETAKNTLKDLEDMEVVRKKLEENRKKIKWELNW